MSDKLKIAVDLHMHSALSPCGDSEMTPGNIVGMAVVNGLSAIALTDHNISYNVPAAVEIGKELGIIVIPGMELETAEQIHVVCLFPDCDKLLEFQKVISKVTPDIPNKKEIFGSQLIYNSEDEIVGEHEGMLLVSTTITIDEALILAESFGGIAYPAHVDRDSYSVLTTLGALPYDYKYDFVEISCVCDINKFREQYPDLNNYKLMRASDAHYIDKLQEANTFIEVDTVSPHGIIEALKNGGVINAV